MTGCVVDEEPHVHTTPGYYNPDDGPGPMCERHYNEWRREQGKQVQSRTRKYTQPDERTLAWQEAQAQREAYNRARIIQNDRGRR